MRLKLNRGHMIVSTYETEEGKKYLLHGTGYNLKS